MALAVRRRFGLSRPAGDDVLQAILEDNQRRMVAELQAELRVFEGRYEIPSEDLRLALSDGRLRDTDDVCDWMIAWETYRAASQARPARVE